LGPVSEWSVPVQDPAPLRAFPGPEAKRSLPLFALSGGPAQPQPRRAKAVSNEQAVYRRAVAEVLRTKGRLVVAAPRLTQTLRVDLDGDGAEEVILVANGPDEPGGEGLPSNGYTAVLIRYVVPGGKVRTIPLGLSTSRIENRYDLSRGVLACVDIDGDGRLEVVTYATQYESEAVEVWTFDGKSARRVQETGWGA
jgi:hypothetical protein